MQRTVIIILAVMVSLPLVIKSRMSGDSTPSAAFSVMSTAASSVVKVSGEVRYPGIYQYTANIIGS